MKRKLLCSIILALLLCASPRVAEPAVRWVRMGDAEIEGRVIGIAADSYVIDIGVSLGSTEGSYYLVYSEGGDVYDADGALIGSYKIPQSVIRASNVSMSESICKVVLPSKEWVIQRGDGVIPITEASAHGLKFATYRTTPDAPRLSGYNGRWVRTSPILDPVSVIVKYYVQWNMPGLPQGFPTAAAPGYYYLEFPMAQPLAANPAAVAYHTPPPAAPPAAEPVQPLYRLNPPNRAALIDFDVNRITDARLIKVFPLTQVEMYALEIQHRRAYHLYSNKRYREALDAFSEQSVSYFGNYLSPYWAGMSAKNLKNRQLAATWFKNALQVNPLYQPAKDALDELEKGSR